MIGVCQGGPRNRKTARKFGKNRKPAQKWTKPRTVGMLGYNQLMAKMNSLIETIRKYIKLIS